MRFLNWVVGHRWAMEENAAAFYCGVLESIVKRKLEHLPLDKEAIQAEFGKNLDNTYAVETRDGVAIIDVDGPIFKRADMFDLMSGATSTELMATDFNAALGNKDIKAIIFNINSPGGEAAGTNEFADMIYNARGQKPIVAYVDGMAASAAYWIASACDEIVTDELGDLGSIGTVVTVVDTSGRDAMLGIERHEYATPGNKRPKPGTKQGDAMFRQYSSDNTEVFAAKVARNRGVSVETVTNDFGGGWILTGQKAVDAGLADRTGSFEQLLSELSTGKLPKQQSAASRKSQSAEGGKSMGFVEDLMVKAGWRAPEEGATEAAASTPPAQQTAPVSRVVATTEPVQAAAPPQPVTVAGMTEAEIVAMKERDEANKTALAQARQSSATAFAGKYATRYLENGSEGEQSDRAKAMAALEALHVKAASGEPITTTELSALMEVPVAASILPTGTLSEEELEGATPHQSAAPVDEKKKAADKAVDSVKSNYKHVAAIGQ